MNSVPSFEKVNYAIRPNKNVERKLIFECLGGLGQHFDLSQYTYIGLGSMWFIDFILAHKRLLIKDMVSIEKELDAESRANFNRPYCCIKVEPGETTIVLPSLLLDEKHSIIWLDHDSDLKGTVLRDIEIICEKAKSGCIFIVTLNANVRQVKDVKNKEGKRLADEEALRYFVGGLAPEPMPKDALSKEKFPQILGKILIDHMKRSPRIAGTDKKFVPIFNFYYRDTAPMITVGGMLANQADAEKLSRCQLSEKYDYIRGETQYHIAVPHLTPKEKFGIDQLLPSPRSLSAKDIEDNLGFSLKDEHIKAYCKFYRFYPMFGEIAY